MPKKMFKEDFIKKAKEVHGDKYDYTKVEYVNNKVNICIICPEHGEFWQRPIDHLNGYGCSKCGGVKRLTTEEFINKAKEIHGNKYDYSKVEYINNKTKICIICPKHGEFWITPNRHLSQKQGCKLCKKSKMENELMNFLYSENINFIYQYRGTKEEWLGRQSLDFYLPDYNIAIECQGEQHYKSVKAWGGDEGLLKRKKLDKLKEEKCKKHGIKIIYVGESSYAEKYGLVSLNNFKKSVLEIIK